MYDALVKLIVLAAILQLGLSASDFIESGTARGSKRLNEASRRVLKIDWKPISVFPEEAKRFR